MELMQRRDEVCLLVKFVKNYSNFSKTSELVRVLVKGLCPDWVLNIAVTVGSSDSCNLISSYIDSTSFSLSIYLLILLWKNKSAKQLDVNPAATPPTGH